MNYIAFLKQKFKKQTLTTNMIKVKNILYNGYIIFNIFIFKTTFESHR